MDDLARLDYERYGRLIAGLLPDAGAYGLWGPDPAPVWLDGPESATAGESLSEAVAGLRQDAGEIVDRAFGRVQVTDGDGNIGLIRSADSDFSAADLAEDDFIFANTLL